MIGLLIAIIFEISCHIIAEILHKPFKNKSHEKQK